MNKSEKSCFWNLIGQDSHVLCVLYVRVVEHQMYLLMSWFFTQIKLSFGTSHVIRRSVYSRFQQQQTCTANNLGLITQACPAPSFLPGIRELKMPGPMELSLPPGYTCFAEMSSCFGAWSSPIGECRREQAFFGLATHESRFERGSRL